MHMDLTITSLNMGCVNKKRNIEAKTEVLDGILGA